MHSYVLNEKSLFFSFFLYIERKWEKKQKLHSEKNLICLSKQATETDEEEKAFVTTSQSSSSTHIHTDTHMHMHVVLVGAGRQ